MERDAIIDLDKAHLWHPYTAMRQYIDATEPLVIARAEGAHLWDVDGRSYLDGNASWWSALLGHRHPRLVRALHEQSERLCHVALAGITHEPAARLGEALCAVAPEGMTRVFYSDDGSTSVEVALKLALQLWFNRGRPEKTRFVALEDAFHGETLGVTGLGGVEAFRRPFAAAGSPCAHVPAPPRDDTSDAFDEAVAALEATVAEQADRLAAVVLEPCVQGAAGMRIYHPRYLAEARRLCDEHGVLLILDEVFTGYGRTGPMWACDHAGVTPDILCTAKGFTAGILPMAATLATDEVFEGFLGDESHAFYYGHTYCGHPLGAAIALEVLAIYREERVIERARPKADRIAEAFTSLGAVEGVANARSLGMIGALELGTGRSDYLSRAGWRVYQQALERGAYVRPLGNTVYVTPPLTIDDADLDRLLAIVDESVRAALRDG